MIKRIYVGLLVMLLASSLRAQDVFFEEGKIQPYYVSLNGPTSSPAIKEIHNSLLHLSYTDRYGESEYMVFSIYDGLKQVAQFKINKTYGLNYYTIDLSKLYSNWKTNFMYRLEGFDDKGDVVGVAIKLIDTDPQDLLELDIFVNPTAVHCDELTPSQVSYLASVHGGRSPYQVTWYVLSKTKEDLLYQPRQEQVKQAGNTPMISVDAVLDYHVMIHVEDACGRVDRKMAHITCDGGEEQVNTIFIQPILKTPTFKGN